MANKDKEGGFLAPRVVEKQHVVSIKLDESVVKELNAYVRYLNYPRSTVIQEMIRYCISNDTRYAATRNLKNGNGPH